MTTNPQPGIYLIVEFDWPKPFETSHAKKARALHDNVQEQPWIEETVAASGGLGEKLGSIWIFKLANYAALDTLLNDETDPVATAYRNFFSEMAAVEDRIREEVVFL
jgi:hypothetical protein